ncbi:MAG: hypothetical protein IPM39_11805 [Chloroflexi bacterium]|nr:hypothetical protein [Chloroflexota bacterium]
MSRLEARLQELVILNPQQMKDYADMVAIVARVLKRKQKGNEATVHAEVKRQFQVPSYQLIPEANFDTVKRYLRLVCPPIRTGAPVPTIFEQPAKSDCCRRKAG